VSHTNLYLTTHAQVFGVGDFVYKADDICRVLFIIAAGTVEVRW